VKGKAYIFGHNSKVPTWNEDLAWHPHRTLADYNLYLLSRSTKVEKIIHFAVSILSVLIIQGTISSETMP
jgi:hypothetical protein